MNSADILSSCVTSLRNSIQSANSSINILESGVKDFPRLTTVLHTTRHFELVSESELKAAQSALVSEIGPEVENLLGRVETYLEKLARKEKSLKARCELQEGRLSRHDDDEARRRSRTSSQNRAVRQSMQSPGPGREISRLEEIKMQQLRQKKDRLSYAVGRLELQASQQEKRLRKSMAGGL